MLRPKPPTLQRPSRGRSPVLLGLCLLLCAVCEVWAGGLVRKSPVQLTLPVLPQLSEWTVEPAFPGLDPVYATAVASPPGSTNSLVCVSKYGRVYAITNLAAPTLTVALDLSAKVHTIAESGILGIAFHPGFQTNHQVYITYELQVIDQGVTNLYNRLSRFRSIPGEPLLFDPASEQPLLTQFDQDPTHNGGDLEFGPDGYLYVSLGDEGGANNLFGNAWYLDKDFFSAILRLDVDRNPDNLDPNPHPSVHTGTYKVPRDNPFVGLSRYQVGDMLVWPELDPARVRTEFFAVGFRNPWRLSFDTVRGELYANDVGQSRREEINRVERGGNHGWMVREGTLDWPFAVPHGGLVDPVFEYEHDAGRVAITGSLYYHGTVYPGLEDSYLFSDYNGDIGVLRRDDDGWNARWFAHADSSADLGVHPGTGEILITDVFDGILRKLVWRSNPGVPLPARLSDTGAFSSLETLTPSEGIVPYALNVPFWSDGAEKRRWFGLRDASSTLAFRTQDALGTPVGGVWIKHFDILQKEGDPQSRRRLETRFIVRNEAGIYGMTYRWNAAGTDATLVPPEGADEILSITNSTGVRSQRWRYPSTTECRICHTAGAGWVLGFSAAQLNREVVYDATTGSESQLAAMAAAGYLDTPVLPEPHRIPRFAAASETAWSAEHRVRSYLAANCAQCHHPGAPNAAKWDARFESPLEFAGLLDAIPINRLESADTRIVAPGSLELSVLYRRVNELVGYHMPPLATFVRDTSAVALLEEWILKELPARRRYDAWVRQAGLDPATEAGGRTGDPDVDGASNAAEFNLNTDPMQSPDPARLGVSMESGALVLRFQRLANQVTDLQWSPQPGSDAPWESVPSPANRYEVSPTDTAVEVRLPADGPLRFFRLQVAER